MNQTSAKTNLETPNKENFYRVTRDDLPLHCPLPGTSLWNSHPKVFLPVEKSGRAKCLYCGAVYELVTPVADAKARETID